MYRYGKYVSFVQILNTNCFLSSLIITLSRFYQNYIVLIAYIIIFSNNAKNSNTCIYLFFFCSYEMS